MFERHTIVEVILWIQLLLETDNTGPEHAVYRKNKNFTYT